MAFKMKGSPHKMGTMEGTSAHKSALKAYKTMKKYGNDAVKFGSTEGKSTPNKMGKDHKTMSYMKTPYEQAKPDYLDMDKDGDKKESMKKAIADKSSNLKQRLGKKKERSEKNPYEPKKVETKKVDKPKEVTKLTEGERKKPSKENPLPQSCPDGSAPVPLDEEGNPLMQKNIIKKVKGTVKNIAKNIGRGIRNKKRKKVIKKLKKEGVLQQKKKTTRELGKTTTTHTKKSSIYDKDKFAKSKGSEGSIGYSKKYSYEPGGGRSGEDVTAEKVTKGGDKKVQYKDRGKTKVIIKKSSKKIKTKKSGKPYSKAIKKIMKKSGHTKRHSY